MAQQKNLESTAELFPMIYSSFEKVDGYLTESEYDSLLIKFEHIISIRPVEEMDSEVYAKEGAYNIELVKLMAKLLEKNQEFRMSDIDKQYLIDKENIRIIDSLFQVHEKYIGKSLVGKSFSSVMQIVIQHADLNHQEKYLPIVHQATKSGDLPLSSLKYLIDRIYNRKYGYQIFGTQMNVFLADDITKKKLKMNLDSRGIPI